jgi:hypothetical protein
MHEALMGKVREDKDGKKGDEGVPRAFVLINRRI